MTKTTTNARISSLQGRLVADMRQLMKQKSISQAQMAMQMGISEGSLSDLMHERRAFSATMLSKIGRVLCDLQNGGSMLFTSLRQYQKMVHVAAFTRKKTLFSYPGYWPLQKKVDMLEALQGGSQHYKDARALQRAQKKRMQEAGKAARKWRPLNKERLQQEERNCQAGGAGSLGRGAGGLSQAALHRNGASRHRRDTLDTEKHKKR